MIDLDFHKVKGRTRNGEHERTRSESGCSSVRSPRSVSVHGKAPDEEGGGEEEGESGVTDVANDDADLDCFGGR
jgi:hypothetical protein